MSDSKNLDCANDGAVSADGIFTYVTFHEGDFLAVINVTDAKNGTFVYMCGRQSASLAVIDVGTDLENPEVVVVVTTWHDMVAVCHLGCIQ